MQLSPDTWDKETLLALAKLVAWGLAAIAAVFSGTGGIEETTHSDLHASEAQAAAGNADVRTYGAYDDFQEYIEETIREAAACDSALEAFSRHREDDRDFQHVLAECHSEGEI
jgi:hypothetical protein